MINTDTNILVLSPHTDDAELGCGGLISRFGADVISYSFCGNELIEDEFRESMTLLGCEYTCYDFPVRRFNEHRQDILDTMIREKYDIVFCPSSFDKHQDHRVIYEEAKRAFNCSIFGYELPWNCSEFKTDVFIPFDSVEAKLKALACYKSQAEKPYFNPAFITGLAKVRGVQAGCEFAESFEAIRVII